MIALLQRVTEARVDVGGEIVAEIGPGLLVLLAVEPPDDGVRRRSGWSTGCFVIGYSTMPQAA